MIKNIIFGITLLLLLQSCHKGYVLVEKSENLGKEKVTLRNSSIYYLEPNITSIYIRNTIDNQFLLSEKYTEYLGIEQAKAGKKAGLRVNILSEATIKDKYTGSSEELLQLRRAVLNSTALQENPLNSGRRTTGSYKQQKVFVATPRFPAEFAHLSKDFSPYFGITGIFAVDSEPTTQRTREYVRNHKSLHNGKYYYYYHIVVNIETSEVIYREIKLIPFRFSKTYLSPIIFDSYASLKMSLK